MDVIELTVQQRKYTPPQNERLETEKKYETFKKITQPIEIRKIMFKKHINFSDSSRIFFYRVNIF